MWFNAFTATWTGSLESSQRWNGQAEIFFIIRLLFYCHLVADGNIADGLQREMSMMEKQLVSSIGS